MENKKNKLSICSCTWNLHEQTPSEQVLDKLLGKYKQQNHDIYVIGTEECLRSILMSFVITDKTIWETLLLNYFDPNKYKIIASSTLNAIHLVILIKIELYSKVSMVGNSYIKTGGAGYYLGNKGAVYIWFKYDNIPLLFINCHLAAFYNNQQKRIENYEYITDNIVFENYKELFGLETQDTTNNANNNNQIKENKPLELEDIQGNKNESNTKNKEEVKKDEKKEEKKEDKKDDKKDDKKEDKKEETNKSNKQKLEKKGSFMDYLFSMNPLVQEQTNKFTNAVSESFNKVTSNLYSFKDNIVNNINNMIYSPEILKGKEIMNLFHFILFSGDFNSRSNAELEEAKKYLLNKDIKSLLKYDQFKNSIEKKEIKFNDFQENEINFLPTYKVIPDTIGEYYTDSLEHLPSFTDRIFYKVNPKSNITMKSLEYTSDINLTISDHKPVLLTFELYFN